VIRGITETMMQISAKKARRHLPAGFSEPFILVNKGSRDDDQQDEEDQDCSYASAPQTTITVSYSNASNAIAHVITSLIYKVHHIHMAKSIKRYRLNGKNSEIGQQPVSRKKIPRTGQVQGIVHS
jgi:hypothetical protein